MEEKIESEGLDNRKRLDIFLHVKGFAESREKAKQLIMNSCVFVDNKLINKPSLLVPYNCEITIKNKSNHYVGRGAEKLEKAISCFNINAHGCVAVDVGASTGGFTDCLLQHGVNKVYAVDVGHDQLHESLKNNNNVINLENTNFRYIDTKIFKENIDIIVVDVSFISLGLILPKIAEISKSSTDIITLIKPQFEAGKNNVGKKGIVKDKKIHAAVLNKFMEYCNENNIYIENITYSPIRGGNGNIEYLAHLKTGTVSKYHDEQFKSIIEDAFVLL